MAKLRSATSPHACDNLHPPSHPASSTNQDGLNSLIVAKYNPIRPEQPRNLNQQQARSNPEPGTKTVTGAAAATTHSPILTMITYLIKFSVVILMIAHVSSFNLDTIKHYTYCQVTECCHPDDGTGYIKYRNGSEQLLEALRTKVYGQPLIINPIYKAIKTHLHNDNPRRPLVMYFSGWTGTGKTHVARLIATSLYQMGMQSKYVSYISLSYHFPVKIETEKEIAYYREKLRDMIKKVIRGCERSLFILDELDKLPAGVVDALQPLFDYVDDLDGLRYSKAIFIFLSNTGAEKLNALSYKMFLEGKERKDLSAKDVQDILTQESFTEPGGLNNSSLLKRSSIGVFVPFLPLERSHVKLCIKDEIESLSVIRDDESDQAALIDVIADEMLFFPEETQRYSKSGCKGVHDKVVNYIEPSVLYDKQLSGSDSKFFEKGSDL